MMAFVAICLRQRACTGGFVFDSFDNHKGHVIISFFFVVDKDDILNYLNVKRGNQTRISEAKHNVLTNHPILTFASAPNN